MAENVISEKKGADPGARPIETGDRLPASTGTTAHPFDVIALLKEGSKPPVPEDAAGKHADDFVFNMPQRRFFRHISYAHMDEPKSPYTLPSSEKSNPVPGNDQPSTMFTVLPPITSFDNKRPTAAFLDDFTGHTAAPGAFGTGVGLSHGDLSAVGAAEAGYNVLRLQANYGALPEIAGGKNFDFSRLLSTVADTADALGLTKGDVLNFSMGNNRSRYSSWFGERDDKGGSPDFKNQSGDPTFRQVSNWLGFEVTAANLKDNREKVLSRLKDIASASDVGLDGEKLYERSWAQEIIGTNDAIDRLQKKGIEVMVAAGNDGKDAFTPEYLRAEKQLAGLWHGKLPAYSANDSLTTPNNGEYELTNDFSLLNPKPISEQTDKFEGTYWTSRHNRFKLEIPGMAVDYPFLTKEDFQRKSLLPNASHYLSKSLPSLGEPSSLEQLSPAHFKHVRVDRSVRTDPVVHFQDSVNYFGTSFVNTAQLADELKWRMLVKSGTAK